MSLNFSSLQSFMMYMLVAEEERKEKRNEEDMRLCLVCAFLDSKGVEGLDMLGLPMLGLFVFEAEVVEEWSSLSIMKW